MDTNGFNKNVLPVAKEALKPYFLRVALAISLILSTGAVWRFMQEWRRVLAQPVNSWTEDQSADCAVVLTGGPNRVREGFDLLARKAIEKLVISGVHPSSSLREIFPQWPYYGQLKEDDVVLERRSQTTFGNVQQSLALLEALQCRDFILVTSRVHMYRALRVFRAEMPQSLAVYPRAIAAGSYEPKVVETFVEVLKSIFYSFWAY